MADVTMTDIQSFDITAVPKDAAGVVVSGAVIDWRVSNNGYVVLTPSADTYACHVKATQLTSGLPGNVVTVSASLSDPVTGTVSASLTVAITASPIVSITLTSSTPHND